MVLYKSTNSLTPFQVGSRGWTRSFFDTWLHSPTFDPDHSPPPDESNSGHPWPEFVEDGDQRSCTTPPGGEHLTARERMFGGTRGHGYREPVPASRCRCGSDQAPFDPDRTGLHLQPRPKDRALRIPRFASIAMTPGLGEWSTANRGHTPSSHPIPPRPIGEQPKESSQHPTNPEEHCMDLRLTLGTS